MRGCPLLNTAVESDDARNTSWRSAPNPQFWGSLNQHGFHVPPELGDAVGELLVGRTPHLGMNSKAHRENPLKRVQEVLDFSSLQPFMGLIAPPQFANSILGVRGPDLYQ
jgi:hypothetical protein